MTNRKCVDHPESSARKISDFVDWDATDELVAALDRSESVADVAWFEGHPDRNYRIRRATKGELLRVKDPPGTHTLTVIRKVPGARIKLFLPVDKRPSDKDIEEVTDGAARWAWWRMAAIYRLPVERVEAFIAEKQGRES